MKNISVILTAWKRSSIEEQLIRLSKQTLINNIDIYLWQNENHIDVSCLRKKFEFHHIQSSKNLKFHGRFSLPLLLTTEYCVIVDDDTLPNPKWLEKCVSLCEKENCIVGGNGRIISCDFKTHDEICVDDPMLDVEVDYVGHCWFFRTEWIREFWKFPQPTFETGEDISFCASLKISKGIRSFVSSKAISDEIGDSDRRKYGTDINSSYTNVSGQIRKDIIIPHWKNLGWKLIAEGRP